MKEAFRIRLLNWWEDNKRIFPWRKTRDPYKILCSEILLQQTNADKVIDAYEKLINNYPDINSLSEADLEDLHEIIKPLGLIKRAERLRNIAFKIMNEYNGVVPNNRDDLLSLSGVGNYTTNAILSFSFNKNLGVLDTNTIRILNRVFDIKSEKARARNDKNLQNELNQIVSNNNSRKINYAMLDFASKICKAKNPKCKSCFFNDLCINRINY